MAVLLLLLLLGAGVSHGQLQNGFYASSCPTAEATVASVVRGYAARDRTIAPALLRLQFHDCFVQGCDASILITSPNKTAERDSVSHQGLRGFDVIDSAKQQLEAQCPGVVSCADIIALAARDAIALTGGASFEVQTGRRDRRSMNAAAASSLPVVTDSIGVLKSKFAANGMSDRDLVLLTGAHTIGTTACFFVKDRIYNFPTTGAGADPAISPDVLPELRSSCAPGDANTRIALDRGSEFTFDDSILRNIRDGYGAIASDAALYEDAATRALVDEYVGLFVGFFGPYFADDFAAAMVRMGAIGVVTGNAGEVRKVCSAFN